MAEEKKAKKRISSARKRDLQSQKRRLATRSFRAEVGTAIRSYETSLKAADKTASQTQLSAVYSLVDKGVKTGRFTINKAARTKSRLVRRLRAQKA